MEASIVFPEQLKRPPLILSNRSTKKLSIGRSSGNDVSFIDNKCLSGRHCEIVENSDGKFVMVDKSTNGILVNGAMKLKKGETVDLKSGDMVHLVKQNSNSANDIFFTFYLEPKSDNATEVVGDKRDNDVTDGTLPLTEESDESPEPKRPRIERVSDMMRHQREAVAETVGIIDLVEERDETGSTQDLGIGSQAIPLIERAGQPAENSDEKTDLISKVETSKIDSNEKPGPSGAVASASPVESTLDQALLCSICCEIIHDCISLQPCMHSFCAGCYSEWLSRSNKCPDCRNIVEKISKNHMLNNVIEAYLKEHPEKKRSDDETKELDKKNKITHNMLYPKRQRQQQDYEDDFSGSEEEFLSETDDDEDDQVAFIPRNLGFIGVAGNQFADALGAPRMVCRQCPGYSARQSLSGTAGRIVAPPFLCQPRQNHILCQCCLQPMPNRAQDAQQGNLPPITCTVCHRHYCNLYWGCQKQGCLGCLNKLKEINFGPGCLAGLILENGPESQILSNYLASQNKTWEDLLRECTAKLDNHEYHQFPLGTVQVTGDTVLCHSCGMQQFMELAFQYRKEIPKENLPAEVRSRPDCYWGKSCRTQKNKPAHAQRFNHVCDQTRFA